MNDNANTHRPSLMQVGIAIALLIAFLGACVLFAPASAKAAAGSLLSKLSSDDSSVAASGSFASNPGLRWTLGANGSLAITGEGKVESSEELYDIGSQVLNLYIGNGVTSIGAESFSFFTELQSVSFEENSSLESIGNSAFYGCASLGRITIPASVKSIGIEAFSCCYALEAVEFEKGSELTRLDEAAFSYCNALSSIELPDGLAEIGVCTFSGCDSLTSITVPASVESIGEGAFMDCTLLGQLVLESPASVTVPTSALTGTPQETKLPSIKLKTLKASGPRKLTLKWSKVDSATGYTVFYKKSGSKSYKKLKLKGASATKTTLKKLAKGKRYTVYVIARSGNTTLCSTKAQLSPKVK